MSPKYFSFTLTLLILLSGCNWLTKSKPVQCNPNACQQERTYCDQDSVVLCVMDNQGCFTPTTTRESCSQRPGYVCKRRTCLPESDEAVKRIQKASNPKVESPDRTAPLRILWVGNSFTYQGPIPGLVGQIASKQGWPKPASKMAVKASFSLGQHVERAKTLELIGQEKWDVVVLQDYSAMPTEAKGIGSSPSAFQHGAAELIKKIQLSSPKARVILFQTWAYHPNYKKFPAILPSAKVMQEQLRFHVQHAAHDAIPWLLKDDALSLEVAYVGDAWASYMASSGAKMLHDKGFKHANHNGQYLSALVLYRQIYQAKTKGAKHPVKVEDKVAESMQQVVDQLPL